MASSARDSSRSLSLGGDLPLPIVNTPASRASSDGKFWLNGEVAGCRCPECGGPMSIRLWLMLADCALCGASLELSEAEERELRQLLQTVAPPAVPPAARKPTAKASAITQAVVAPSGRTAPQLKAPPRKPASAPSPPVAAPALAIPPKPIPQPAPVDEHDDHESLGVSENWLAILVSLLFHILLVMLLALWGDHLLSEQKPTIVLTATWGNVGKPGDQKPRHENDERTVKIEPGKEESPKPLPEPPKPAIVQPKVEPKKETPPTPKLEVAAFLPEDLADKTLPKLADIQSELSSTDSSSRMHQGRDPRIRSQLVEHEGGTIHSEAAVANGLRWITRHQASDGSWGLHDFARTKPCDGRCGGAGNADSDTAATGLALLPLLGAGQTAERGIYREHVARGLEWLIAAQKSNGDLRSGGGTMYAHGIATIALCEAFSLGHDLKVRSAAQRAVDFIVSAQDKRSVRGGGGWRYDPGQPGDLSVVGWQLMALQSARSAGLHVPDKTFERAEKYLNSVQQGKHGGLYSYQGGRGPEDAMIAEGLLCREYLGWPGDHPGLKEGVEHLLKHKPNVRRPNIYYWYYATQTMHHLGGDVWREWNDATRDVLTSLQSSEGHEAGSWDPVGGSIGGHDTQQGGRLYMTALAVCTLEVYYRHLPIYRKIELSQTAETSK